MIPTADMRTRCVLLAVVCGLAAAVLLAENRADTSHPTAHSRVLLGSVVLFGIALAAIARRWARDTAARWAGERYDCEQELSALSQALATARNFDTVANHTRRSLGAALRPRRILLFRRDPQRAFLAVGDAQTSGRLWLPPPLAARVADGETVVCDEADADEYGTLWNRLGIALLVPLPAGGSPSGLLALGPKQSGRPYDERDLRFLAIAGNQIATAMNHAAAFDQVADLNHRLQQLHQNLESRVRDRTAALDTSNAELSTALNNLRRAYGDLERTQVGLVRSERLATLGRLTSGLVHEMNTPLSAVMNSLKMIADLADEYDASVGDPSVLPADHREIAKEILSTARAATDWTNKAGAYLRSIKGHSRESRPGPCERFLLADVVEECRMLIVHRLRAARCELDYHEEPARIELVGDRGRVGQVLVNLIANAIDAYEDQGSDEGRIEIRALGGEDGGVSVRVRDWAGGIPPAVLPHVFDELYTTKGPGRGTGLGLWISRNLIEECFGGTLDVVTSYGGSCFVAEIPERASVQPSDETAEIAITPTGNGGYEEGARVEESGARC